MYAGRVYKTIWYNQFVNKYSEYSEFDCIYFMIYNQYDWFCINECNGLYSNKLILIIDQKL